MKKLELSEDEISTICSGLTVAAQDLLIMIESIESIDNINDSGKNCLSGPDFEKAVLQTKFDNIQEVLVKFNDL